MAKFKNTEVDTDILKERANHVSEKIEDIEKSLSNIKDTIENLGQTWKGEASNLFMAIYREDDVYMEKVLATYKSLNEKLYNATQTYNQGEDQALRLVNSLK